MRLLGNASKGKGKQAKEDKQEVVLIHYVLIF